MEDFIQLTNLFIDVEGNLKEENNNDNNID